MPFYTNSDSGGLAPQIPDVSNYPAGFRTGALEFFEVVVAAGDDTGNAATVWGAIPDTAPAATSDTDVDLLFDSAETVDILRVEASAAEPIWIFQVASAVPTVWAGATAATIGDTNNAAGWLSAVQTAVASTGLNNVLDIDSDIFTSDDQNPYVYSHGRNWAASSGHIGIAFTGDATAGRLAVYGAYARLQRPV
mgnify:CR=1 FL=1